MSGCPVARFGWSLEAERGRYNCMIEFIIIFFKKSKSRPSLYSGGLGEAHGTKNFLPQPNKHFTHTHIYCLFILDIETGLVDPFMR